MRKLSNTNFYSLKDSEDIFLIHKENKNFIKYKEFVSDIVKSLEYISKFEEDTITVFIEDAYKFIAVITAGFILKKNVNVLNNNSPKYVESIIDNTMVYISDTENSALNLDEVFEKGWRKKLEKSWVDGTTRISYTFNWSLDEENNPIVSFDSDKIHARNGYRWTHPVHEVLSYDGEEKRVLNESIVLNHYPDRGKSRSSYLPLLELSVKEDPEDDRNTHYLGREYMYYEKWNEAIDTLIHHLNLKKAVWKDERCASMRFIGRCYKNLNRPLEAEMWYKKALLEAPHLKEAYSELALFYYETGEYSKAIPLFLKTLKINTGYKSYITEWFSTDFSVYDFLSICYYKLGDYDKALEYVNKALELKNDERVINNKKLILEKM